MRRIDAEVVVIGSSFAGSLLALILRRQGLRVVLIDRDRHPRFAIGESSTPAADLILADLCDRYDLPGLQPLAKYGTWRQSHPEIRCGLKRGFSYFHHQPGGPFEQNQWHSNELLVTASASDDVGDTHWYRAEVDACFAREARQAGVELLEEFAIKDIRHDACWVIRGAHGASDVEVSAQFAVDSSGAGAVMARHLELVDETESLETDSWCVFGHFEGVRRWGELLREWGESVADHPFDCDAAALHHVIDGGWIWVLPFDGDITSVGLVKDARRHRQEAATDPTELWKDCLECYPSVAAQFVDARLVSPFETLRSSGRLQRLSQFPMAQAWSQLPGTTGFIDPFYSTGIAHSLVGVERIAHAFETWTNGSEFESRLRKHALSTTAELRLIDRLVAGAYSTFGRDPALLHAVSMLYFAAATTWERRRVDESAHRPQAYLLADDSDWLERVDQCLLQLRDLQTGDADAIAEFAGTVAVAIASYNTVGLCDPAAHNMYRYTAAPA